jgi:cardiolipin synthase
MDTPVPKPTRIDRFLEKTILWVIPRAIKPNHLTVFRFMMVPVVFWLLKEELYLASVWVFALTAFTDALDGALARTRNQCSEWGKLYDPLADKLLIVTVSAVLVIRFLNLHIFLAVLLIELGLITMAAYRKFRYNKIVGAHISGKIKMILQSVGMVGLLGHGLWGEVVPLMPLYGVFYAAIFFGFVSFAVYKSI